MFYYRFYMEIINYDFASLYNMNSRIFGKITILKNVFNSQYLNIKIRTN